MTETVPKALVDICGTPLVLRILASLPETVTEIFIVVGYRKEQVVDAVGESFGGKPVRFISQDPLDGTGSALHLLKDRLHEKFLVVNGDDLYGTADLERLIAHPLAILVSPTTDAAAASALQDENGRFLGLETHIPATKAKRRVCGAYVLDERFFHYPLVTVSVHGKTEYSLPHTIVEMTKDLDVRVEEATHWQPVGTPAELEQVRNNCG